MECQRCTDVAVALVLQHAARGSLALALLLSRAARGQGAPLRVARCNASSKSASRRPAMGGNNNASLRMPSKVTEDSLLVRPSAKC